MSFSIEGKTAIITGGAEGIGLEVGLHFLEKGAKVMFADTDETVLERELSEHIGENAQIFAGDLSKKLCRANLLSAAIDAFDTIDILVNADLHFAPSDPMDVKAANLDEGFEKNVLSTYKLSQLVARRFVKQVEHIEADEQDNTPIGSIINLSSIVASQTQPKLSAFSISMAARDQMTRAFAVSFAEHRIRVNGISIGSVMTQAFQRRMNSEDDNRRELIAKTPLGRLATANEVVETAQYLASEASDFMTGHIVVLDGGRTLYDAASKPSW
ncbi:MAG: SDR family NAD(P)-dependent oxidoreductase [Halocynthiibacter sp.]